MSGLRDLRRAVELMPQGATLTLSVEWLRDALKELEGAERPEALLTLDEVAQTVGRAVSTVRTWCNSGQIEGAFRLNGRDWRVPERALRRYLEGQGEDAGDEAPRIRAGEVDLSRWRRHREVG